ncbi:hypothetical protein AAL_07783 [Moelleriella libera RCEF 2490]|uniref:Uncharacterized protein n=1 Tax=Moelleriella libera RCEF 2490 TaxID=1081109 RepID=A0A167WQ04_9HYPO|nr:hypothetical protein AAL_07783 [Moelleriella libera RCEF 2490]
MPDARFKFPSALAATQRSGSPLSPPTVQKRVAQLTAPMKDPIACASAEADVIILAWPGRDVSTERRHEEQAPPLWHRIFSSSDTTSPRQLTTSQTGRNVKCVAPWGWVGEPFEKAMLNVSDSSTIHTMLYVHLADTSIHADPAHHVHGLGTWRVTVSQLVGIDERPTIASPMNAYHVSATPLARPHATD